MGKLRAALLLAVASVAWAQYTPPSAQGGTPGNVTGPGSSTSGDLSCYADTTGKVLVDCGAKGAVAISTAVSGTLSSNVLRDLPSVVDKGADPSCLTNSSCTDSTSAFQTAAAIGGSWSVPCNTATGKAAYKISGTITLALAGTQFEGCGSQATYILRYANATAFQINCYNCGLDNLTVLGNYSHSPYVFTSDRWPSGITLPSYTDTSSNIIIGVAGTTVPYQWHLRNIESSCAGLDGVDLEDGGSMNMDNVLMWNNAQWGMFISQFISGGGPSIDPGTYSSFDQVHAANNGAGQFTSGGNFSFGSWYSAGVMIKSYGGFGSGVVLYGGNMIANVYDELSAAYNIYNSSTNPRGLNPWVTGTAYTTGILVINNHTVYQATNSATSGATAPTCTSGTCSDGAVTWQFRGQYGIWNRAEADYNGNEVHVSYENDPNGIGFETSSATTSVNTSTHYFLGSVLQYPQWRVLDNYYGTTNYLDAFTTTGGNSLGFSGYEASMINSANRRSWFGVHQPLSVAEAFWGTPDNIQMGVYQNGIRRALFSTSQAWQFKNEGGNNITAVNILSGSSQSSNPIVNFNGNSAVDASGEFYLLSSSNFLAQFRSAVGLAVSTAGAYTFSSTTQSYGTADAGLSRSAAGEVAVGNGTAGDHSATIYPNCIAMADTATSTKTYIVVTSGVVTASTTKPSNCN